jgi:hypothetical protein
VASGGAIDCLQDVKSLVGLGSDGCDVKPERKFCVKYDPQDLGGPEQGDDNTINKDVRLDIKLLVPWGEQGHLGLDRGYVSFLQATHSATAST